MQRAPDTIVRRLRLPAASGALAPGWRRLSSDTREDKLTLRPRRNR